jgi:hypothetical protein
MTSEVISPLRRRMIEDMTIRKLSPKTQQGYIRTIKNLAAFLGRSPDRASFEDSVRVASGAGGRGYFRGHGPAWRKANAGQSTACDIFTAPISRRNPVARRQGDQLHTATGAEGSPSAGNLQRITAAILQSRDQSTDLPRAEPSGRSPSPTGLSRVAP